MTKKDLIDELKYELVISPSEATKAVDVAIHLIEEALSRGESVKISGFGNFHVRDRATRTYRNKSTGSLVQTDPGKRIQFRPSIQLMEMLQANVDGGNASVAIETDDADDGE